MHNWWGGFLKVWPLVGGNPVPLRTSLVGKKLLEIVARFSNFLKFDQNISSVQQELKHHFQAFGQSIVCYFGIVFLVTNIWYHGCQPTNKKKT